MLKNLRDRLKPAQMEIKAEEKSNYTWLLDNGHGGVINGVYQTKGKRSPKFEDGTVLYEGDFNRRVVAALKPMLDEHDIDYVNLVPELKDISLGERVRRANKLHKKLKNTIYISIHGNAFKNYFNDANGVETFHYAKGNKVSKNGSKLSEMMQKHLVSLTGLRDRGAKGADFFVLRKTSMPSILTENGFMTNKEEASLMLTDEFVNKIAKAHLDFILQVEEQKPV